MLFRSRGFPFFGACFGCVVSTTVARRGCYMMGKKKKASRTFDLTRWSWHGFFAVRKIKVEDKDVSDGKNKREKVVLVKY